MSEIFEYRGVSDCVYAEITKDDAENYTTGEVKPLVAVAEINKKSNNSSATHYYDNVPAIVIASTGSDEITIKAAGVPFDALAEITGQYYDASTGMFVEQERANKYFALGYKTKKTDGTEVLVWRLKGSFGMPDTNSKTEDDGTDASGQELTFTGISTTHKFTKTGKPAKGVNVDMSVNKVDASTFFEKVQTPDTVKAKA